MPKVRRLAVNEVLTGRLNQTQTARKYGVTRSAVCKWMKKVPAHNQQLIYTLPSRPKSHPNQLSPEVVNRIVELRKELKRCAPVIHAHLIQEGFDVSLASVGRVLARHRLTNYKRRAKWGFRIPRPLSDKPGALVQIDTMHVARVDYSRFYIFAVLDTFSRLGYAEYQKRSLQKNSVSAIKKASNYFGFPFKVVQSDNGPEFKHGFEFSLSRKDIQVRHSRVRKPNDNAHIERFIRTIQDECFNGRIPNEKRTNAQLKKYIDYYNNRGCPQYDMNIFCEKMV